MTKINIKALNGNSDYLYKYFGHCSKVNILTKRSIRDRINNFWPRSELFCLSYEHKQFTTYQIKFYKNTENKNRVYCKE